MGFSPVFSDIQNRWNPLEGYLAKLPRAQLPIGHCEAAPQNLGKPKVMQMVFP